MGKKALDRYIPVCAHMTGGNPGGVKSNPSGGFVFHLHFIRRSETTIPMMTTSRVTMIHIASSGGSSTTGAEASKSTHTNVVSPTELLTRTMM